MGADRFAVAVGAHDNLVIFGPKGDRVAEISPPAIAQPVTVGDVSFQVSYGRDANGQLTAILTPDAASPAQLHFNVLGKGIDADKAVVTLTFSSNLKGVTVDPGYVGNVEVNSQRLGHHHLADDATAPQEIAPTVPAAGATTATTASAVSSPAPTPSSSAEIAPASSSPETASSAFPQAPAPLASQLAPMIGQDNPAPASNGAAVATTAAATGAPVKLYWSEPVTAPNGAAPQVGLNEIKLVEVHGPVSVTLANGETQTGVEGMTVPSGSKVTTFDNASAALFMGGVNSARLMPRCELTVTQSFDGTVRKTLIDLERGAVFSRVGQRSGETQDYQIRTPEGVTDAETSEMCSFRGSAEDLHSTATTMNSGLVLDRKWLLAWNPTSLGHGLISDVVDPVLAAADTPHGEMGTFFFFASNIPSLSVRNIKHTVLPSEDLKNDLGLGRNSPNTSFINDPDAVLQAILITLQPFNFKLHELLSAVNSGTANQCELAFYHNLISVFFGQQLPAITKEYKGQNNALGKTIYAASQALKQDLAPFTTMSCTPY